MAFVSDKFQKVKDYIRKDTKTYLSPLIIFVLGICLSTVSYGIMNIYQENEANRYFVTSSERYTSELKSSLNDYLNDVIAFKAFFSASNIVDEKEFKTFSNSFFDTRNFLMATYYLADSDNKKESRFYSVNRSDISDNDLKNISEFNKRAIFETTYYRNIILQARINNKAVLAMPENQQKSDAHYILYLQHVSTMLNKASQKPKQSGIVVSIINFSDLKNHIGTEPNFHGIVPILENDKKSELTDTNNNRYHNTQFSSADHNWYISFTAKNGYFERKHWPEIWVFFGVFAISCIVSLYIFFLFYQRKKNELINELLKSEQEQAQSEIILRQEAQQQAEQASRYKSDFLANMSHELRTPLNSIVGMVQIIEQNDLNEEVSEMFSLVKGASHNLLDIVNDILDLSKIEAEQVHLECIAFDAVKRIRDTVDSMQPLAAEKDIALFCRIDAEHLYAIGDELRFTRVLTNLVSNSIRYTVEGNVSVIVKVEKLFDNLVRLRCEVIDTGIGVPKDKMSTIFDKFTQADASITRKFGGTGLGLTITKGLVELMDGDVGVESVEGEGSTFWFEVPFGIVDKLPEKNNDKTRDNTEGWLSSDAIPAEDIRILMAEDNDMNQMFMKKLFSTLNITNYTIAQNGRQAIMDVQSNNFDLVLMDCHMPEMNGYDATVSIRNLPDPLQGGIPIIAMTANAMPEDEEKCLSIGMNAYISKPVDIHIFKEKLSPWIVFENNKQSEKEVEPPPPPPEEEEAPVNLDNLRDNSMGDEDFVLEIISMFISQGKEQIIELKDQCTEGENEIWVEVAHSLKGTAGVVGAEKMRELCGSAQKLKNGSLEEREIFIQEIEERYKKAKDYFIKEGLYSEE
ncbi:MAG: ATP-binding protein [Alphaproteobacteria bacterium]